MPEYVFLERSETALLRTSAQGADRIPKRIIQTGKHFEQPLLHRAAISNVRLLNPDYEHVFFDDLQVRSFVQSEFSQYLRIFDGFDLSIQRYDFFRYLVIYRYGGYYLDLDVLLAEGLSGLPESGCIFPFEGLTLSLFLRQHYQMDWEIGNFAFGATAGHPFLAAVIENCVRAQQDPDWVKPMMHGFPRLLRQEFMVLNTTGPGLLSRTLAEDSNLAQSVTVLFPSDDVCELRSWNRFGDLGIHLMEGSWRIPTGFLRRRLTQYWELWRLRQLLRESRKLGATRSHHAQAHPKPNQLSA